MKEYLTPTTIANQIRMVRTTFKGVFLVVEGAKDYRFYRRFINPVNCRLVAANGKEGVVQVYEKVKEDPFVIAIIDRDFDGLLGAEIEDERVISTSHHDIEISLLTSNALQKFCSEFASDTKVAGFLREAKCPTLLSALLDRVKVLGYFRLASYEMKLPFDFKKLQFSKFTDKSTLTIDSKKLLIHLRQISPHVPVTDEVFLSVVGAKQNVHEDQLQVCKGRDLIALLAYGLRKAVGTLPIARCDTELIESIMRVAYEDSAFRETNVFHRIKGWAQENRIAIFDSAAN